MENKVVCGLIKGGNLRMIYCELYSKIIDDIKSGKYTIEVFPEPHSDIMFIWKNQGYKNFILKIPSGGWQMNGGKIEPKYEVKSITGDALFFQIDDDDYKGLEQEAYRRIIDCQVVGHIYPNGHWETLHP